MAKRSREPRDPSEEEQARESTDPDFRRRRAGESVDARALRVLAQRHFERTSSSSEATATFEQAEDAAREALRRRRERQARGIADVRTATPGQLGELRRAGLLP